MQYADDDSPSADELLSLYDSVGWVAYSRDPARLVRAVRASLRVVTARQDGHLAGLARLVGDGETIVYLQDILVRPPHQRHGVGEELLRLALGPYGDVRQKVLITDDEPGQRAFYESVGFTEVRDLPYPIRAFVNFDS